MPLGWRRKGSIMVVACALAATLALGAPSAGAAGRCGQHPWCDTSLSPDQRAALLLGQLTMDEKVSLLAGNDLTGGFTGGPNTHTGQSPGVARVDVPPVYYSDGPQGPRQGASTGMPSPMALAATFDPQLAYSYGAVVGNEVKDKGNDVVFGPTVNIMRTPLGGRTFEGYGEDPFLVTRTALGWIEGAQSQGVIGNVKHFAANNQEGADPTNVAGQPSFPLGVGALGDRYVSNSIVDDRTLHEIYLPQFEAAVKQAHVGSVMCSYNQLDGQYACENKHLLQGILLGQWGFHGYVLADYGAAHNTIASLNNGLDFEPWPGVAYSPPLVDAALAAGQATPAQVDDHVRAVLRTLFAYGFFDRPAYVNDDNQIDKPAHAQVAQRVEQNGITLLENKAALPLNAANLKSVAVIGKAANTFVTGGGSGNVTPFALNSVLSAITARVGPGVPVSFDDGSNASQAAADAKAASVAVVFVNDYDTEGTDRKCLTLECPNVNGDQDGLISQVAAAQPNTIVVMETGGPDLTPWRDQVKALLEAWYPGAPDGPSIARVLFGDVDPGGRLPVTFPSSESQLPTAGDPEKYPGIGLDVTYKEGVLVGYRWYDANNLTPAFPFGFGLSYTSFRLDRMSVAPGAAPDTARVSFDVTNTGARQGIAVPQLYVGLTAPDGVTEPPLQLRGFSKLSLASGETRRLTLPLDQRALSYWDSAQQAWRVAPGCDQVVVGQSSRDVLAQRAVVATGGAQCRNAATVLHGRAPCVSRRSVRVHLRGVRRSRVRTVMVYMNGRRVAVLHGPRSAVAVRLTLRRGQVRVRVVVRRTGGSSIVLRRTYHPCSRAPRRSRSATG
jgi:beta-glucosidase